MFCYFRKPTFESVKGCYLIPEVAGLVMCVVFRFSIITAIVRVCFLIMHGAERPQPVAVSSEGSVSALGSHSYMTLFLSEFFVS